MMRFSSTVLLLCWVSCSTGYPASPDLHNAKCSTTTSSNTIQGLLATTYDEKVQFCSFLGIKFGTAKRYQESVPYKYPEAVIIAQKDGPECPQLKGTTAVGDEDCLLLSVHSPNMTGSLPVLVYIHGGGFGIGSVKLSYQKPDFFMETQRVVMVFIQYRLGALGFVDFNSDTYPANLGMKDQVLALKWVKENIHSFGGNPEQVTIQGESAGAASVSLHLISPLSKGLFRAGISESGSACCGWAAAPKVWARQRLGFLAGATGCPLEEIPQELTMPATKTAGCLLQKTADQLVLATYNFSMKGMNSFLPVIEKMSFTNPFLTEIPWTGKRNQVPWISGINSNEAGLLIYIMGQNKASGKQPELYVSLPNVLYYDFTTRNPDAITIDIQDYYNFDIPITMKNAAGAIKAVTAGMFGFPNYQCHRDHTGSASYNYYFNYVASAQRNRPVKGVFHTEELQYLFIRNNKNIRVNGSSQDIEYSKKLVDLWVSFVETNKPSAENVEWEQYNPSENRVLVIDESGFNMAEDPNLKDNLFWDALPFRELMP